MIAWASFVIERSLRSSSDISSRRSKTFMKPQVSCGLISVSASPALPPTPMPATSSMKRLKKTAWRASSTCCVARKYFCSSSGAASMYGESPSVTASSPQKKSE